MDRRVTLVALAALLAALAALYFWSSAGSAGTSHGEPVTVRQEAPEPPAAPAQRAPPPQQATAAAPAKAAQSALPSTSKPPSEVELMEKLRANLKAREARAILEVIDQLEFLYPDSPQAPERSNYAIDAHIALNQIHEAREEARKHFDRWPNSPFAGRVHAQTGVRPPIRPPTGY